MSESNKTRGDKLVFSIGGQDETLEGIILQIWNDGAEGIFYNKGDFKEFRNRIKKAIKRRGT